MKHIANFPCVVCQPVMNEDLLAQISKMKYKT